jgi:hypothetical protein
VYPLHGDVRIRIIATPKERELDGVRLDVFKPGKVCDVSSSIGAWFIANGYALAEMRKAAVVNDLPRARSEDRRRRSPR